MAISSVRITDDGKKKRITLRLIPHLYERIKRLIYHHLISSVPGGNGVRRVVIPMLIALFSIVGNSWADSWEELHPKTVPQARSGHTMVNLNGKVYLFAGQTNTSAVLGGSSSRVIHMEPGPMINDLWSYSEDFVEVVPDNEPPTARRDHSAVVTQDKMHVSFGMGEGGFVFFPDVWEYDPVTNRWREVPSSGGSEPSRRSLQSAVVAPSGKILVFGGQDKDGAALSDLWTFNPSGGSWTKKASLPGDPRFGHSAAVSEETMFVFGGKTGKGTLNEMWTYNISEDAWAQVQQQNAPPARALHATAQTDERMWIFGGETEDGAVLNETWEYRFSDRIWTRRADLPLALRQTAAAVLPSQANRATTAILPSHEGEEVRILSFGGENAGNAVNRTFRYSADALPCDKVEDLAVSPNTLKLKKKESENVTVTATGKNNCPVEGATVTATVNKLGSKRISVSPTSSVTDENGEATFTITAKNRAGSAKVIFKAGDIKVKLKVTVKK